MTTQITTPTTGAELVDELRSWLEQHWDLDLTLAEWWERLGTAGWSAPSLPTNAYGRGLQRSDANVVAAEIAKFGAIGAPGGLGLMLAAPTIATHGTQEQIDLYGREIVTGQKAWCQLFSEPGAGSDLAGLTTKAIRDGDEYIVTGQKVWTSGGQMADMGMLLARTNPDAPKHQGITWFAMDMHQPGVDIRPLREMTGHAMFNEVFMTEARVPASAIIGDLNNGWAAANTTLANERAGLGAGGGGAGGASAQPGTIPGQLNRRVGDLVGSRPERRPSKAAAGGGTGANGDAKRKRSALETSTAALLANFAKGNGKNTDPVVRQRLAELHILGELGRINGLRLKAVKAAGGDIPGMANIAKLSMSIIVRLQRDLGLQIIGAAGMLHAYTPEQKKELDEATGNPFLAMVTGTALYAQAPPIYGGTDQIQRNIIGERVLGLPKEPGNDTLTNSPFSSLPKNA